MTFTECQHNGGITIKKTITLILIIAVLASMTACTIVDIPTKEQANSSVDPTAKVEKKEEVFGLNETAVFNDIKFTATKLKESKGTKSFKPESGNVFVGIKFTIQNTSDEEQTISSLLLFDGYVDDVKCEYSFSAAAAFDDGTLDGTLAPGKKMIGWYAMEVPKNWKTIDLDVQSDWLSSTAARFVFKNKD